MNSHIASSSSQSSKRSRGSEGQCRRKWSDIEERTLLDGLKELCARGFKADNDTFRHGYSIELEKYISERLPTCGIKSEPHISSKLKSWKKNYGTISLLKNRSGLGFQYDERRIIVNDPKAWDDLIKIDPNAKGMLGKTWPYFVAWEEIFGKDRATREFAEGPLDAADEIEKSEGRVLSDDTGLGIPIDVDDEEEDNAENGPRNSPDVDDAGNGGRNSSDVPAGEADNAHGPSAFTEASQSANNVPRQTQQGNNSRKSSSQVNDKEKSRKRKRNVEYDDESSFKELVDVMKQYTDMQDKKLATLIDRIGERDHSEIRERVDAILSSPAYAHYSEEQQIKAQVGLTSDIKRMEMFLRSGEVKRQTIVWMIITDTFPST